VRPFFPSRRRAAKQGRLTDAARDAPTTQTQLASTRPLDAVTPGSCSSHSGDLDSTDVNLRPGTETTIEGQSNQPRGSDDVDWTAVGKRLAAARRARGLTQAQVAEHVGVKARAVWSWENAEFSPTTSLPRLAELLGVSTQFLLYGVEESSREMLTLRHEIAHLQALISQSTDATAAALEALAGMMDDLLARVDALRRDEPDE
jgi:transcriptional regulator with XRE-family HTH domain